MYEKQYDYGDCPIKHGEIRLMILKPDAHHSAEIVVQLRVVSIQEIIGYPQAFKYTALSHNWGSEDESKTVFVDASHGHGPQAVSVVNGFSTDAPNSLQKMERVSIKPNLYAFLQEFRLPDREVALWVDRICINQKDHKEKQSQVAIMGQIYSAAASVTIWLGPADKNAKTDRAMDFINLLLQDNMRDVFGDDYATDCLALLHLMCRPVFSRRWIIQELAVAKSIEVRCGSKTVKWRDFAYAVSSLADQLDHILEVIKRNSTQVKSLEGIKEKKSLGAWNLVDALTNIFQRQVDGSIYAPRQGLESLVSSLSTFKTSDPRDTIYALLDLATETCKLSLSNNLQQHQRIILRWNPAPEPDYSIDLLHLYTKFTKWCIGESHSLDIICRRWALPELEQKLDEQYPELMKLPSWIKTVEESESRPQNEGLSGRKTANSLVGLPGNCCYNASNGHFPNVEFRRDKTPKPVEGFPPDSLCAQSQIISDMNLTMTIRGRSIGVVSEFHPMHGGIIPSKVLLSLGHVPSIEPQNVPDAVWRILVADRDVNGRAVPGWYRRACMECLSAVTDAGDMDTNAILQRCDPPTDFGAAYLKRVQAVCFNRNYIGCEDANGKNEKLVGIAPLDSKVGDVVCILFGCSVPCILRPFWDERWRESQPSYYKLVGEAFVLGQMDGEALDGLTEKELTGEEFSLM
ncbi:HET-domain-containing protein [Colletotrichum scovillei]|uniref:HET-domain-containing protein n=1 Tax=Colletotrichum scovillei TaxID=1209932 RepID=A0A9P7R0G0_9PEZI|nr:HET-domain-containing protein [Colletotrichum scovillei]KAG7052463.1 HET-domain-containing protein [Colletotrichum scovillei]KAG7064753.1 HET-domain-containing protein [Colletotrichum scovillei]